MTIAANLIVPVLVLIYYAGPSQAPDQPPVRLESRLAERNPADGLIAATVKNSVEKIYLHKDAVITSEYLAEARVVPSYRQDLFDIDIVFTEKGAERMSRASETHIGRPMAILIDGKVVSAPTLRSRISDRAVISGSFTKGEADRIASQLNSK